MARIDDLPDSELIGWGCIASCIAGIVLEICAGIQFYRGHEWAGMGYVALTLLCSWGWYYLRANEGIDDFYEDWSASEDVENIALFFAIIACIPGLVSISLYDGVRVLARLASRLQPRLRIARKLVMLRRKMGRTKRNANLAEKIRASIEALEQDVARMDQAFLVYQGVSDSDAVKKQLIAKKNEHLSLIDLTKANLEKITELGESEEASLMAQIESHKEEAKRLSEEANSLLLLRDITSSESNSACPDSGGSS